MQAIPPSRRLLWCGLAVLAAFPARAESDFRKIRCARPCQLALLTGEGSIAIKTPLASGTLRTLAKPGDAFNLEAGKDYVLKLNESPAGFFRFDLSLTPAGQATAWTCRVRTLAVAPFISVESATWSGPAGKVTSSTDRVKPLIELQ